MNETIKNILERRSVRNFKPQQIKDCELETILEAGKYAPSSLNRQPWHFTVVQNAALLDRIVKDNLEFVKSDPNLLAIAKWANVPNYHNFYHAPTVIFISGQKENMWHLCDCALAMQNMSLAAQSLNIGSLVVASANFILKTPKFKEYGLNIPDGFTPLFELVLGYNAGENAQPAPRREGCVNYVR